MIRFDTCWMALLTYKALFVSFVSYTHTSGRWSVQAESISDSFKCNRGNFRSKEKQNIKQSIGNDNDESTLVKEVTSQNLRRLDENLNGEQQKRSFDEQFVGEQRVLYFDFEEDPKDIEYKEEVGENFIEHTSSSHILAAKNSLELSHDNDDTHRPLQLLFLGGSNTYGARIENHKDAYPYHLQLLPDTQEFEYVIGYYADKVALNATGTSYFSLCLESLLEDEFKGSTEAINIPTNELDEKVLKGTKSYDIIVLEFAVNGFENFELLLKRLRQRYPQAVLLMLEIWTLASMLTVTGVQDKTFVTARDIKGAATDTVSTSPGIKWNDKCDASGCGRKYPEDIATKYGAYIYKVPRMFNTPGDAINSGLFTIDWNHLTPKGHANIANGLSKFIQTNSNLLRQAFTSNLKPLGTYGTLGDQCYDWHHNGGYISNDNVHYSSEEFELRHLDPKDPSWKHVLELRQRRQDQPLSGTITIESRFDIPVPLGIKYLSFRDFDGVIPSDPPFFPKMEIWINNSLSSVVDPNQTDNRIRGAKMLRHSQVDGITWKKCY